MTITTVQVTISVQVRDLPDSEARAHARWMAERHGLIVSATTIKRTPENGKPFVPASGKPGSVLTREGRSYQVWSAGPYGDTVWVIPTERQDGDAPIYLLHTKSSSYRTWPQPHSSGGRHLRRDQETNEWVAA